MEFYQKRKPAPPKVIGKFESTFLCPHCFILMVATKEDDGKYHGKCMSCLKESTHELPKPKEKMPNPQLEQVLRMNRGELELLYQRVFETSDAKLVLEDLKGRFFSTLPLKI